MALGLCCAGSQLTMSSEEGDLEQLIKGGPFELGLYADKLGSHMFGIDSAAQVQLMLLSQGIISFEISLCNATSLYSQ